eukprot:15342598-Ditylum_brightwellii.AAC.1
MFVPGDEVLQNTRINSEVLEIMSLASSLRQEHAHNRNSEYGNVDDVVKPCLMGEWMKSPYTHLK